MTFPGGPSGEPGGPPCPCLGPAEVGRAVRDSAMIAYIHTTWIRIPGPHSVLTPGLYGNAAAQALNAAGSLVNVASQFPTANDEYSNSAKEIVFSSSIFQAFQPPL